MIDFLYPGFLLFGAAAALPVVIHLLQRHRARVVEFSSVALLHGVERRTIRRLRLRQVLLLLLRSLILLLLALALARPVVQGLGPAGITGHVPTAVAIAVDNSMSMGWVREGRSLLDRGLERVRETLDSVREGDRALLVYVPRPGTPPATVEGIGAIREALDGIRPLPIRIDAAGLAAAAAERLEGIDGLRREVHLYTDLQASAFRTEGETRTGGAETPRPVIPANVRIVLLTERTGELWNGAVTDLRVVEAPLTPGEGVRLEGTVRARGAEGAVDRVLVRLRREDGRRELREVELDGEGRGVFTFALGAAAGTVRGVVEVDPDPLALDNRRYFTVRLPGRPRVWCPSSGSAETPLRTALRVLADDVGSIELEETYPGGRPGSRDVLVIESPRPRDAERLLPVVSRGMGGASVVLVPSPDAGGAAALNALVTLLGLPERYGGLTGGGEDGYVRLDRWSSVTGETRRFLDAYADAITALRFPRFLSLSRDPAAPEGAGGETIDFHTGEPWALLRPADGGWRVLFASGFGPEWGELYRDALFVPFLDTLLRDLVRRGGLAAWSFRPGERAVIDLPGHPGGRPVDLVLSDGGRERVYPAGGALVRTIREGPGNVAIEIGGEDAGGYAVNPEGRESILDEASPEEIAAALGVPEPVIVRAGAGLEDAILTARGGRDVWRELLFLALLLLCLEAVLANRGAFGARGVGP